MNYTCANCGEECVSTWSGEEAREDMKQNYPGWDDENMVLLCEPCYDEVQRKRASHRAALNPGEPERS